MDRIDLWLRRESSDGEFALERALQKACFVFGAVLLAVFLLLLFDLRAAEAQGGPGSGIYTAIAADTPAPAPNAERLTNLRKLVEGAFGAVVTLILCVLGLFAAGLKRFRLSFSLLGMAAGLLVLRLAILPVFFGNGLLEQATPRQGHAIFAG